MEIQLEDASFQVTVVKEKRKTVTLKILSAHELLLKSPRSFSDERLRELLMKKKKWILEHTAVLAGGKGNLSSIRYEDGEKINYMGSEYTLRVNLQTTESEANVKINGDEIIVEISDTSEENIKNHMLFWYKDQARHEILRLIKRYQFNINEKVGTIRIKSQKSRWGSCSELKNLNFNWHLILLPERLMEYVVVHELCHLKQLNHSVLFWDSVKAILPDYEEREKELKEYTGLLF